MNSFMSWVGGKKALREEIVKRLPLNYGRYIEVFGGGGWVLFHKGPDKFEVYNDFNQNLVNLYRCVKEKPDELIKWLEFSLDSRADFEYMTNRLKDDDLSDCQRAAYYYSLIRYSYASGVDSFGSQPHDMWKNFPLIRAAHARLRNTIIENKDFKKLIDQHDRPISFFIVILRITIPKIIMTVADSERTITKDLRIRFAIYKANFFCHTMTVLKSESYIKDREFLLKVLPELTILLKDMRAANNIQNFSYQITIHRNE